MTVILCLLFAIALIAPRLVLWLGTKAFYLLALPVAGGAAWTINATVKQATGTLEHAPVEHYSWMPAAHLDLTFRLGPLEALFGSLVLTVGTLILIYCAGYFHNPPPGRGRRLATFSAQMMLFTAAMYGLVVSDNILLMYVFWELTSVLSFLLVGYYAERASSRRAASQALLVTAFGGLIMLIGLIAMGATTGYWTFSELTAPGAIAPEQLNSTAVRIAVVLLIIGALTKSAIAPFHFWLPGAMAAPTPVSAFLHSAAMVKAGIFLVTRLSPTFSAAETWHLTIIPLGLVTMVMGAWMALRQRDLKLILAYGTVSQLGFIMTVAAIGTQATLLAALALTFGHAMFKATLFMVAGAIDHTTGTRDVCQLSGLGRRAPQLLIIATLAGASMAGVPPLFGFVAKEAALDAVLEADPLRGMPGVFTATGLVLGSILTVAYTLYLLTATFRTKPTDHTSGGGISDAVDNMDKPSPAMLLPAWLLALAGVVTGLVPKIYDTVFAPALPVAAAGNEDAYLSLWHGWTVPLLLTAIILLSGLILHWQRNLVKQLHFDQPALGNADTAFEMILRYLRRLALTVTAITQRGSLPFTEAIILLVLIVLPLGALLAGQQDELRMEIWDSAPQGAAALVIIIAALAATRVRNRLSGVILVGLTGYGLAIVFALYGAPDLALTQLLVETIVVVFFMLILRTLPPRTASNGDRLIRARAWLAVAVGITVATVGAFAMAARHGAPASDPIPELARDIGHGSNAVNVLLVDIRAWDTFGEVSVLVIVAVGITSLVFRTHSMYATEGLRAARQAQRAGNPRWLTTTPLLENHPEPEKAPPLMVQVATRFLFPAMLVVAAYLFFAGHNAPGGGFAAGLVTSLAITLRYLAGGRFELLKTVPIPYERLLGLGLVLALIAVVTPMFFQRPPLSSDYVEYTVPGLGEVALVSPLIFDLGVFFIVVGTITSILRSLGSRIDVEEGAVAQK